MTICRPDHHVIADVEADSCQCGAVLVTDRGLRLAAAPDLELTPREAPTSTTDSRVTVRSWTFTTEST